MSIHLMHAGAFGAAVMEECRATGDIQSSSLAGQENTAIEADMVWLVMGQADLGFIETIYQANRGRSLICGFICARYAVITPVFDGKGPCPSCFRRRFLGMPPPGLTNEAAFALSERAGVNSGFEASSFATGLPSIMRSLLQRQSLQRSGTAVLIDQASTRHLYAELTAVHGCPCRKTVVDGRRTTAFYEEIFA